MPRHDDPAPDPGRPSTTRRRFLHQAAGLAAGLGTAASVSAADTGADSLLPTIRLGRHAVTRLIIGGNPIYGYSHFNRLLSQHQTDWHTPERVVELLKRCEQAGLNCWQNSYAERTLTDLERFRAAGGKLQWLCLGKPDWDQMPDRIDGQALPSVELVAMAGVRGPLHPSTREGLARVSARNEKAIVLLNRRGWSNFLSCRSC